MADPFRELREELYKIQEALHRAVEGDDRVPGGTPPDRMPGMLRAQIDAQRALVVRFINAMGPHMPEAWKDNFVDVFDLEIDMGNPYLPVRIRQPKPKG